MADYLPTIGLEIHAELRTKTKMFCNSKNDPELTVDDKGAQRPNVNICPVCTGQPGTLPVINKEAVRQVLRVGTAFGSRLADYSEFDRKNYFYPDIPKGYQISQYKYPLVSGGSLRGVDITRVHLEEDTARSQHTSDSSLVDFNRAGVPLMELVTEPVIHDAKTAGDFARELQLLLRYLGASEANMEKGQMRVEANISVAPKFGNSDSLLTDEEGNSRRTELSKLGTKVEVKNLNSFRAVEKAIEYEIKRQIEAIESGEKIVQETRGWDDVKQRTFSQRKKESSHDYRYFPEPDLPKLKLSEVPDFAPEELRRAMPELPWIKRERYAKEFGIKAEDIESYVTDPELATFFERVVELLGKDKEKVKLASNYITTDLMGHLAARPLSADSETRFPNSRVPNPGSFASLVEMIIAGDLSSRGAKDVLAIMLGDAHSDTLSPDPRVIAESKGLLQQHDEGALLKIVEQVISDNGGVVEEYKAGKEASLQFLIGQGMRLSKGSANPGLLAKLFKATLAPSRANDRVDNSKGL